MSVAKQACRFTSFCRHSSLAGAGGGRRDLRHSPPRGSRNQAPPTGSVFFVGSFRGSGRGEGTTPIKHDLPAQEAGSEVQEGKPKADCEYKTVTRFINWAKWAACPCLDLRRPGPAQSVLLALEQLRSLRPPGRCVSAHRAILQDGDRRPHPEAGRLQLGTAHVPAELPGRVELVLQKMVPLLLEELHGDVQ